MTADPSLWVFFLMVLGIIALPGMDMAFVLSNALVGGRAAGLMAVAGIVLGGVVHVVAGTLGIAALLQLVPGLMRVLLVAGSLYIAWIGWSILRSHAALGRLPEADRATPPGRVLAQALATSLMNPKAYLFMVAVFPQFLPLPQQGSGLWLRAAMLGLIIGAVQASLYGGLACMAARSRAWLGGHPGVLAWVGRAVGVLLIAAAASTAVRGWQAA